MHVHVLHTHTHTHTHTPGEWWSLWSTQVHVSWSSYSVNTREHNLTFIADWEVWVLFSDHKLYVHRKMVYNWQRVWEWDWQQTMYPTILHSGSQHEAASYPDSDNTRLRTRNCFSYLYFHWSLPRWSLPWSQQERKQQTIHKETTINSEHVPVGCSPWWLLSALQMFYLCVEMALYFLLVDCTHHYSIMHSDDKGHHPIKSGSYRYQVVI